MENVININHTKENALEFEMTIEGVNTSSVECNFVIEAKSMELRFGAKLDNKEKNLWLVKLPKLDILERTAYKCYTEVIVDGQYFKPMEGNVNVVGSAEIYSSTPKNKTIGPAEEKKDEKPVKKTAKKKATPKKKVEAKPKPEPAPKPKKEEVKEEAAPTTDAIDELIKKIKEDPKVENEPLTIDSKIRDILHSVEETKEEKKKEEPVIDSGIEAMAEKILAKEHKINEDAKAEPVNTIVENTKAAKVKAILEEAGIKTKRKPRLSIKTKLLN